MPIVTCIICKGSGKSDHALPVKSSQHKLTYIHSQCEFCKGEGSLQIKKPSAEWRKKADEAQLLARRALGK